MIRKRLTGLTLSLIVAGPVAAQHAPPRDWGSNPEATHYSLAAPANQLSELSVEFRDGETGAAVAVLLRARFIGGGDQMFVEGVCTRTRTGYACTLNDGWRAKASLTRTAGGFTVAFARPVKFQEISGTGDKARSPYDSDLYYHDVAGTYRVARAAPR